MKLKLQMMLQLNLNLNPNLNLNLKLKLYAYPCRRCDTKCRNVPHVGFVFMVKVEPRWVPARWSSVAPLRRLTQFATVCVRVCVCYGSSVNWFLNGGHKLIQAHCSQNRCWGSQLQKLRVNVKFTIHIDRVPNRTEGYIDSFLIQPEQ